MVTFDIDTASHTVGETFGLFEDFLEHEVRIATFLNLSQVDINLLHCQLLFFAKDTDNLQFFTQTDNSNVAIFQIDDFVGIFNDRTGVTAQEEFTITNTYHQRTLLTGSDNLTGVALVDNGNGIGANYLEKSHLHSF